MKTITCDVCGPETPELKGLLIDIQQATFTSMPDRRIPVTLTVQLSAEVAGVGSDPDLCIGCIREAVQHGEVQQKAYRA